MEFLGHGRAADDVPTLEHGHLQPRRGEIGGADEPVMPTPDDDDVGAQPSPLVGVSGLLGMLARIIN